MKARETEVYKSSSRVERERETATRAKQSSSLKSGRRKAERKTKMEEKQEKGEEAPNFPAFPYKPYAIQIDFMNALYHSLNKGGLSMLESPTGKS